MFDDTALERQIGVVLERMSGPEPVFDALAIARAAAAPSPTWRFQTMFSPAKAIVAGALVALFSGFLLSGVLTAPRDGDMAPAAVTDLPSPMTTEELLSSMVTEEVEPGVFRVDSDGLRPLSRPMGTGRPGWDIHNGMEGSIVAGLDGSVWWFDQDGFFRLGEPEVHAWPNDRQNTFFYRNGFKPDSLTIDLEVGPDGTVWLAREVRAEPEDRTPFLDGEVSSFDGESWSVHQEVSDGQATLGVEVMQDGQVWAAWAQQAPKYPWSHVTVARLGDAGWEPLPEVPGDHYGDLSVAAAGGGEVWLMPGVAQRLQRHDGNGWEVQMTPEAGYEMRADAASGGTLWVRLSPHCSPGAPGSGGCIGGPSDILARFDGTKWEVFDASDGIPLTGHHVAQFFGFFEAAPDGSVWFDPTVPDEEFIDTDCDGVANFDGRAVTRYLRGMCIYAMDVAPNGAVWVQGRLPTDEAQLIDTHVITLEAMAASE